MMDSIKKPLILIFLLSSFVSNSWAQTPWEEVYSIDFSRHNKAALTQLLKRLENDKSKKNAKEILKAKVKIRNYLAVSEVLAGCQESQVNGRSVLKTIQNSMGAVKLVDIDCSTDKKSYRTLIEISKSISDITTDLVKKSFLLSTAKQIRRNTIIASENLNYKYKLSSNHDFVVSKITSDGTSAEEKEKLKSIAAKQRKYLRKNNYYQAAAQRTADHINDVRRDLQSKVTQIEAALTDAPNSEIAKKEYDEYRDIFSTLYDSPHAEIVSSLPKSFGFPLSFEEDFVRHQYSQLSSPKTGRKQTVTYKAKKTTHSTQLTSDDIQQSIKSTQVKLINYGRTANQIERSISRAELQGSSNNHLLRQAMNKSLEELILTDPNVVGQVLINQPGMAMEVCQKSIAAANKHKNNKEYWAGVTERMKLAEIASWALVGTGVGGLAVKGAAAGAKVLFSRALQVARGMHGAGVATDVKANVQRHFRLETVEENFIVNSGDEIMAEQQLIELHKVKEGLRKHGINAILGISLAGVTKIAQSKILTTLYSKLVTDKKLRKTYERLESESPGSGDKYLAEIAAIKEDKVRQKALSASDKVTPGTVNASNQYRNTCR